MKKTLWLGTVLLATSALSMEAAQFKFGEQTLIVPDGFEVELVAGTNLVKRPISMSYDEKGRLYVTDSSGSSEKGPKQLEDKSHRILRLEDTDGDGKFDKSSVFADKVMFPEGCLWFDGSLYVSAPPSIWKFTDSDGDGVAEKREEWHQGKTLTGCANDLHGPYLGPDGFIYWCKGAFAEQTYEVNGKPFTSRASHIFRARPDHTRIEPVLTGGMDNPVGVAFSQTGERFLAGTFFEPGNGLRDGVIHAIYGGVYGKPHPDVLDAHKKTGDLMPVMVHLGPAASCDVISYKSGQIGEEYVGNLFVCNFNLHSVTRHILTPDGATFKPKDEVFLSCEDPDFHPTCVLEDADGSLLVVDTGGWYKICCPTSQLYKPDILGAIYRVRKKNAHKVADPRGWKLDWENAAPAELVKRLDDSRTYVVERTIQQLAKQGDKAVPALSEVLKKSKSEAARLNAMWALTRIDHPSARQAVRAAFPSGPNSHIAPDDAVTQVAIYSVSLWRDSNAISAPLAEDFYAKVGLSDALGSENAAMQRIAAEAWGRIATDKKLAVNHLFGSGEYDSHRLAGKNDRVLEHSLTYALIELNDPVTTAEGLTNKYIQKLALIALDQMDNGNLKPEQVAPFLLSTNVSLKETASRVISHHPDWGTALAGFFKNALAKKDFSNAEQNELARQLAQLASDTAIQELLTTNLQGDSSVHQIIALRAMAGSGLNPAPGDWAPALATLLKSPDKAVAEQAVATARSISFKGKTPKLTETLLELAKNDSAPAENRLNALSAMRGQLTLDADLFQFLRDSLDPARSVNVRSAASGIITRVKLTDEQLLLLADTLKTAGPLEISKVLSAFEKSTNEALGLKIVATLKDSKSLKSVRGETIKQHLGKYSPAVQAKADELVATLNVDAAKQAARVDEILASLKNGDIRRGQIIFNSPKVACFSCHAIGHRGGKVGPDLTRIGQVRTERDLLEAILYPSASFVRSFEPMIVSTKGEEEYSGIVKKDAADEVVLVTGPNAESHIRRADIIEMRPGTVSVMPQGLDEQLSKQELADLVAFLKATRW